MSAGDCLERNGRRMAARRAWERGARRRPAAVLLERLERLNASEGRPERTARLYRRLAAAIPTTAPLPLLLRAPPDPPRGARRGGGGALGATRAVAGHPLAHALWGELHRRRGNHNLAADTFARAFGPSSASWGRSAVPCAGGEAWSGYCRECRHWGTLRARAERVTEAA